MVDRFVTRAPDPVIPDPPPTVEPNCTCFIASGLERLDGVNLRSAQGAKDAKGRPVCQVHFPVTQEEFLGRAVGDEDN